MLEHQVLRTIAVDRRRPLDRGLVGARSPGTRKRIVAPDQ
jgi:hypothetical protein